MQKNVAGPRTVDLAHRKFGRLTVVRFDGYRKTSSFRAAYWWVRCSCGAEKRVEARALKSGLTISCGCVQRERAREVNCKPPGVAGFNRLYGSYKYGAKHRGHEWNLTEEQAKFLFEQPCVYCGQPPKQISKGTNHTSRRNASKHSQYVYSGIDRIDNSIGYEVCNCVSCCQTCNLAKRDMTYDEFVAWINRAYEHLAGKGEV